MPYKALKSGYSPDPVLTSPENAGLASRISDAVNAAKFPQTILRFRNDRAAQQVGLDGLSDTEWTSHFGRFQPLPDNLPQPLALRYHGHQFRHYNSDIGDGRGFLFAQLRDGAGRLLDLGTKGSGQTPYSRFGDGRLTLKGAVREILATEMLEALGVPTSRSFSVIETGESLDRGDEPSPTRSAVLVRLNHSHIRIGTFQRLAQMGDEEGLAQLTEYCLNNLFCEVPGGNGPARLMNLAVERVAELAASYMVAGFVHGVLNTDNINITGESFDYGPWRFAPQWRAQFTAAYFDETGLYSFGRQAEAMHWNLGQLAVSLRPLVDAPPLIAALERFSTLFQAAFLRRFLWRLGVKSRGEEADRELVLAAENMLAKSEMLIDDFFHQHQGGNIASVVQAPENEQFLTSLGRYRASRTGPLLPKCSMLIEEVEQIWTAIAENDDWAPLNAKVNAIRDYGNFLSKKASKDK